MQQSNTPMTKAIKIQNLSKQYRLGLVGIGILSHDLKHWWTMNIRGKEDPYLKIGETNDCLEKRSLLRGWFDRGYYPLLNLVQV